MPFDMTLPPGCEDCADAWARLKAAHDAIWQKLFALDDAEVIDLIAVTGEKLGSFKAGEYKFKFGQIIWHLVGAVPANGGVGATESLPLNMTDYTKWTGANTRILRTGLLGYDAWHDAGLNYLALHETAHTTMLGLAMTQSCWNDHRKNEGNADYGMTSPAWIYNERFANDIALAVARRIKVAVLGQPGAGYDLRDELPGTPPPPTQPPAPAPQTPAEIPLHLLDVATPASAPATAPPKPAPKPAKKSAKKAVKKKSPAKR